MEEKTKRIFTAIGISEQVRQKVSEYIKDLRVEFPDLKVGWEKTEKLHLTLKFLGDINEKQLANLTEAVKQTTEKFSTFDLKIAETGVFPNRRKAKILWLDVLDENENLFKLNSILENECEKRGFAKEKGNFKAHLTIARLREPHKFKKLVEKHLANNFDAGKFEVGEILIIESKLLPHGSIYKVVSSIGS